MKKYSEFVNKNNLKVERMLKNLTCENMAELLGAKSATTYSNIENGNTCPNIPTINKISEILGKPANYFFKISVQETQVKEA